MEFNLLEEPWLPVVYNDGKQIEVSLRTIFRDAHRIKNLAGELPTQDAAILRFILAIVYRVVENNDPKGTKGRMFDAIDAYERWEEYWNNGSFPSELFDKYLSEYADRFYLIHPDRPFYQYPIDKGSEYKAKKLRGDLAESNNKAKMFSSFNGKDKDALSYGESVRWLIHLISYDDASLKPIHKKDGEKMDSAKVGWLGRLGLVYLKGKNLFETLMLNLVLVDKDGEIFPEEKPVWELDTLEMQERRRIPIPKSPIGVLTVQSRRVRLLIDNGAVTGYTEYVGDQFADTCSNVEQMTMWRQDKETNWVPKKLPDPSRAIWRDYTSLLVRGDKNMRPGVIRWGSELVEKGLLTKDTTDIISVNIFYVGGSMPSDIDDIVSDSISVNSKVLSKIGDAWNTRIDSMLIKTDECVRYYGLFVKNVMTLNGASDNVEDMSQKETIQIYNNLDKEFRRWLFSIDPDVSDMETKSNEWLRDILYRTIATQAEDYLKDSDPRSYIYVNKVGEKGTKKNTPTSSIKELKRLKMNIRKIIDGD